MVVYHGSNMEVRESKLIRPIRTLYFGPGFYTTLNRNQAIEFARKVVDRNDGSSMVHSSRSSCRPSSSAWRRQTVFPKTRRLRGSSGRGSSRSWRTRN